MAYTYTPTYYSSLHDSITSICKNILPFSFKKRRLPAIAAAEKLLSKQQSDNLKWQQESFHQILNLMGLCKEGILHEDEVSAFRSHLLETLIASPIDYEPPVILRDKLIFLQELLYSKCISEDEYHASKRPLLQRLAVQGAEIGETDVIVAPQTKISNEEKCLVNTESLMTKNKAKEGSNQKKMKGGSSVFAFVSPDKYGKLKEEDDKDAANTNVGGNELMCSTENPFWGVNLNEKESESKSILMMESLPEKQGGVSKKGERKPFRALFQQEDDPVLDNKEKGKLMKKTWGGFDGFKKWKKNKSEDETAPLSLCEKSDNASYVVENSNGESRKKLHSPADLFVDEAFGENVKKELCRIQTELDARSARVSLSSRCDQNGNPALNVVRERENSRGAARLEKRNSKRWTTFDDEENSHPNLFAPQDSSSSSYSMKQARLSSSRTARSSFNSSSIDKGFKYNPFFDV
ncbi:hypothetical protein ACS0TY_024665 [Phlomoides rotata]